MNRIRDLLAVIVIVAATLMATSASALPSASDLLDELSRRPRGETQEQQMNWLSDRLSTASEKEFLLYEAAVTGACSVKCPIGLQYAQANLISLRISAELARSKAEIAERSRRSQAMIEEILKPKPAPPVAEQPSPTVTVVRKSYQPRASAPPKGTSTIFQSALIRSLEKWSGPIDEVPPFVSTQIAPLDDEKLDGLQATLAARCAKDCPASLVTARLVIENAIAAREKVEDRNSNLWIAVISGIAGALVAAFLSFLAKVGKARGS